MGSDLELATAGATPVVVRRGVGPAARRLRLEGERLARAAHPGVVQVVSSTGDDDAWELVTSHGGRPLPVASPLAPEAFAGVVAAVASTLADLHELGVVHGRLRSDHILLGPLGRPVLCGFGPGPAPQDRAPAATPADDVAALGSIIVELLGGDAEPEPMPERRWQRRRSWSGWVRRSLLTLADQACAEPPTRRPSARRFAAAISEAVPGAGIAADAPPPVDPERPVAAPPDPLEALRASVERGERRDLRPQARRMLARTGAGAVVIGLALAALGSAGITGDPAATRPPTPRPPTTGPPAAPVETTSQPPSSPPCAVPVDPSDGALGCAEPITVVGTFVTVGSHRFEVGQPGDEVVVGDWDCDGTVTPALLRASTGDVFVFPGWADDEALTVRPAASVPGARALVTRPAAGCHGLAARMPSGELVVITEVPG